MKKKLIFMSCVLALIALVPSCSKKDTGEPDIDGGGLLGGGAITMEIDGVAWKSTASYMVTYPPDEEDFGELEEEFFHVVINGPETNNSGDEDDFAYDGITLLIRVPKAEFRSPKGTYDIVYFEGDKVERSALAYFQSSRTDTHTLYIPYFKPSGQDDERSQKVGEINITGFEIGKQPFLQVDGYTKLSGTFFMDLNEVTAMDDEGNFTGKTLKITKGEFNLKAGLGLGGLFSSKQTALRPLR